jgi:GH15 family glucan-1,4-alpha-glucosidase
MTPETLELAVVGNCSWGGLVDASGRLVWACLPRFDSDPIFPALLDERPDGDGSFAVELLDLASSQQRYDGNTPILVTTLRDRSGAEVEVRDFAPRFQHYERIYRPTMLIRRLRPLRGDPRIRIVLRPRWGYGAQQPTVTRGSHHLRFVAPGLTLRLTTNAPISFVADATPFVLDRPIDLILGPDESLTASIEGTARDFQERTSDYWTEWSRTLSIPFEWQDAVIRAAIALKLCHFEETGAIVAALTTSIPEAPGTERNWDYRYCWPRDSYFVIHALNRLGTTKTMESYLTYIGQLAASAADGRLQPVYGVGLEANLAEGTAPHLKGYRGMGPVRIGNQAYLQPQNDVYGSVVLAATHSFFDRRLLHPGGRRLFELLERLGEQASRLWDQPDAGPWELRSRSHVHTFSAVMCWAACDRLARIARQFSDERARHWRGVATRVREGILARAWNATRGCLAAEFGGEQVDATLLLLAGLGFLPAADPRFHGILAAVERDLRRGSYLLRYAAADDFGVPRTAFSVCTFWYVEALAAVGRHDEARELFENMLARRSRLGLLSEDLDPATGELWGNFPQTYSMVGLINAAMRLSKRWEDAF